jgi:hypothetical protein
VISAASHRLRLAIVSTTFPPGGAVSTVGRNDPCPCGSGKKYKKCCLEAARPSPSPSVAPVRPIRTVHDLDGKVVEDIVRWAAARLAGAFAPEEDYPYEADLTGPDLMLFTPWCVYEYCVGGARVAAQYFAERGATLPEPERAWIEAQLGAWLSVWEVLEVEPGTGLRARDLLTGEERFVREVMGSRMLTVRDGVLGRVVDFHGASYFCGMHPCRLPPRAVAEYVEEVRKVIADGRRAPKSKPLPIAWLREEDLSGTLIWMWQDAVEALQNAPLPKLQNTDGDDVLLTKDLFDVARGARDEVERLLRALPWAEQAGTEANVLLLEFRRPGNPVHASWENTIIGMARLGSRTLKIETNSVKRADLLRGRVEEACGDRVRWRAREHEDPETTARGSREPPPRRSEPPPEVLEKLHKIKAKHYAGWLDTKIQRSTIARRGRP